MAKSISRELREWAGLLETSAYTKVTSEKISAIADRIDAEMVELPKGKDGEPIHVEDTIYGEDGRAWHVRGVTIGEKSPAHPGHVIRATSDANEWRYLKPEWLSHECPDSWDRIADELEAWCDQVDVDGDACGEPRELAARIRWLAEEVDNGTD